ncbi:MAG: hypothetical protein K9K21_01350 [Desulfotignum sp.]|nr:hypothetical protein [Desulfotignum sp.]
MKQFDLMPLFSDEFLFKSGDFLSTGPIKCDLRPVVFSSTCCHDQTLKNENLGA